LATPEASTEGWLWYAIRTAACVPLDRDAYTATIYDHESIPWPRWACKAPDGGVHVDASVGPIDIHVAKAPSGRDEVTWTCDFGVFVVSRKWLAALEDLIDGERICLGRLYLGGEVLQDWATLHEVRPPALLAAGGKTRACPICGNTYTLLHGHEFFADPTVLGRPLIVGGKGIFVREDEAIRRNLRTPAGAYKPSLVRFEGELSDDAGK
jgi:hypothetical protein